MKVQRKIIFETKVGSHLYGTNRPDSDDDFLGVFMSSTEDILSLQNPPSEWTMDVKLSSGEKNTKGDVDRKYFSLQKFLKLAAQGQSGPLEMLFSPENLWSTSSPEWKWILQHRNLFVSKNSITPIIGFATAQAHKATLKADNLNYIRLIITKIKDRVFLNNNPIIDSLIRKVGEGWELLEEPIETWTDQKGMFHIRIAGRSWPVTANVKLMYRHLIELEGKYGSRSEAAAQEGYDYKSLMHAYRLIFEAKEMLTTGSISLPRPPDEVAFLKNVRGGLYKADYFEEIETMLTELRQIKEASSLPETVNMGKIETLCQDMLYIHLMDQSDKQLDNI